MREKKKREAEEVTFEYGSENVFADLGLENADELLVKEERDALFHADAADVQKRRSVES